MILTISGSFFSSDAANPMIAKTIDAVEKVLSEVV
jgi:hypothetical protein